MIVDFKGSAEAADEMVLDTGELTTETDGVSAGRDTIGSHADTIFGDVINRAVLGDVGEGGLPCSVTWGCGVDRGPARRVLRWAAWWRAARRRFFTLFEITMELHCNLNI